MFSGATLSQHGCMVGRVNKKWALGRGLETLIKQASQSAPDRPPIPSPVRCVRGAAAGQLRVLDFGFSGLGLLRDQVRDRGVELRLLGLRLRSYLGLGPGRAAGVPGFGRAGFGCLIYRVGRGFRGSLASVSSGGHCSYPIPLITL